MFIGQNINTVMYQCQYNSVFDVSNTRLHYGEMDDLCRETLKKIMKHHGHNAYDLATLAKTTQPTIFRFLSGQNDMSQNTAKKIAGYYKISLSQLRGEIPIEWLSGNVVIEKPNQIESPAPSYNNDQAIVPGSDIKRFLFNFINKLDDDKLTVDIVPVIQEFFMIPKKEMEIVKGMIQVLCEKRGITMLLIQKVLSATATATASNVIQLQMTCKREGCLCKTNRG